MPHDTLHRTALSDLADGEIDRLSARLFCAGGPPPDVAEGAGAARSGRAETAGAGQPVAPAAR